MLRSRCRFLKKVLPACLVQDDGFKKMVLPTSSFKMTVFKWVCCIHAVCASSNNGIRLVLTDRSFSTKGRRVNALGYFPPTPRLPTAPSALTQMRVRSEGESESYQLDLVHYTKPRMGFNMNSRGCKPPEWRGTTVCAPGKISRCMHYRAHGCAR